MSQVFIEIPPSNLEDDSEYLQLTVSTSLTISMDNQITQNPIADRRTVADHSISRNKVFSLSGVISDIRNLGLDNGIKQLDVKDNLKRFEDLRDSRQPFILHFDKGQDAKVDCVFRQVNFSKASNQGNSYSVAIVMEQVLISRQVLASNEKFVRQGDIQNQFGSKNFSGNGNTEEEELINRTLINRFGNQLLDAFNPVQNFQNFTRGFNEFFGDS